MKLPYNQKSGKGKGCKRSKLNTLEGREGKMEKSENRRSRKETRLRGGMSRPRPRTRKSWKKWKTETNKKGAGLN